MSIARYLSKLGALLGSDGKVPTAGIADGAVTALKVAAASLTGDKFDALAGNGYVDIGTVRIQWATAISPGSAGNAGSSYGVNAQYYCDTVITFPAAFKTGSTVRAWTSIATDYHEAFSNGPMQLSTTSATVRTCCSRTAGITGRNNYIIVIGEKP